MYGEVHQAGEPKVYKSRWHFCYRCGAAQAFLGILFGKAALPREQSLFDTDLGDTFECAAHHLTFVMAPQAKEILRAYKTLSKRKGWCFPTSALQNPIHLSHRPT